MICLVEKKKLYSILEVIEKVVERYSVNPLLSKIHIQQQPDFDINNCVKIFATNLTQFVEFKLSCNEPVQGDEGFAVCPRVLKKVIQHLDNEIYLKFQDGNLTVGDNDNTLEISKEYFFESKDFIAELTPDFKPVNCFETNNNELQNIFKIVAPATAKYDLNNVLSGIGISNDKNIFSFAATDGNRLHVYKSEIKAEPFNAIVAEKTFNILNLHFKKLKTKEEIKIKVEYVNSLIKFSHSGFSLISKTIEGQYPAYTQLIPNHKNIATVNRIDFLNKLKILLSVVNERTNIVSFDIQKDIIKAKNGGETLTDCKISTTVVGEPVFISFNIRYLIDIFRLNTSKEMKFYYDHSLSGTIVKPADNENITHLIMPVQVN